MGRTSRNILKLHQESIIKSQNWKDWGLFAKGMDKKVMDAEINSPDANKFHQFASFHASLEPTEPGALRLIIKKSENLPPNQTLWTAYQINLQISDDIILISQDIPIYFSKSTPEEEKISFLSKLELANLGYISRRYQLVDGSGIKRVVHTDVKLHIVDSPILGGISYKPERHRMSTASLHDAGGKFNTRVFAHELAHRLLAANDEYPDPEYPNRFVSNDRFNLMNDNFPGGLRSRHADNLRRALEKITQQDFKFEIIAM